MTTLSNSDKLTIVEQKIKNIDYQKYGLEIDLQLANAVASPDAEDILSINSKLTDIESKLSILNAEKATLEE